MKLIRYGDRGQEKIGVQIDDKRYDVSAFGGDYDERFFAENGLERLAEFVSANAGKLIEIDLNTRLGSPIARPSKLVCIGLNYKDHAEETGAALPEEPIIFMKSTTALNGPNDAIMLPKDSVKTDWEVEFCVVIGKEASYVEETEAMDYVAGYLLHNDVSERAYQLERGGTWDKGKGCDTFAPLGPFLVTRNEIPDINNIKLWLKVNGKIQQSGNTSKLIFSVAELVAYTSKFMRLLPGDVISTGTPAGVGLGMKPAVYLAAGDVVELGADYLGEQRQEVVAYYRK